MDGSGCIDFGKARDLAHKCLDCAWDLYGNRLARRAGLTRAAGLGDYCDSLKAAEKLCEAAGRIITDELLDALWQVLVRAGDRPQDLHRLGNVTSLTAHGLAFKFLSQLLQELLHDPKPGPVLDSGCDAGFSFGSLSTGAGLSELERQRDTELNRLGLSRAVMDTKIRKSEVKALGGWIDREWGSAKAAGTPDQTEQDEETGGTGSTPKKPRKGIGGRRPLKETEVQKRLEILEKWDRAKEAGTDRKTFCRDECIKVGTLKQFFDWRSKRRGNAG